MGFGNTEDVKIPDRYVFHKLPVRIPLRAQSFSHTWLLGLVKSTWGWLYSWAGPASLVASMMSGSIGSANWMFWLNTHGPLVRL
ncbi:MAG: hypothetical protein LBS77_00085 [Desulfovibrio sp.]|jgi:hypothetical protein|nr:hypothetical protein [Desulfovibrio sp.]